MVLRNNFKKYYIYIFLLVLFIFTISSQNAWWKNRIHEGKYYVIKYPDQIPFMWQYDLDAREIFRTVAFFPDYYKENNDFIDRPVMPLLANYIGSTIYLLLDPLIKYLFNNNTYFINNFLISKEYHTHNVAFLKAFIGIIFFKIFIYFLSGILAFNLLIRFISINQTIISITFIFSGTALLHNISQYHFYEYHILTPVIIIFLFINIVESYSLKKNIIFSLIIGILMLTKSNYAVYLTILFFSLICFINKKFILKNIFISLFIHLIPLIIWHIYLDIVGIGMLGIFHDANNSLGLSNPFSILLHSLINIDATMKSYYPGANLINEYYDDNWIINIQNIQSYIYNVLQYYGNIWILFTIYFFKDYVNEHKKSIIIFILTFIFFSFIQCYVAWPNKVKGRLLMDPMFIFYSFGICGIYNLVKNIFPNIKKIVITIIMISMIFANILPTISPVWIHPMKQIGNNSIFY